VKIKEKKSCQKVVKKLSKNSLKKAKIANFEGEDETCGRIRIRRKRKRRRRRSTRPGADYVAPGKNNTFPACQN
jgi:hypothetical protein